MKKGFYKSSRLEVKENYGGVVFSRESHYYIGYIDKEELFFVLIEGEGIPNWKLFEEQYENIDIKGEIIFEKKKLIKISFYNPYLKTKEIFTGRLDGDNLYLKSYRENEPDVIWLEDIFKYVCTKKS